MIGSQPERAGKQVDSEIFERANDRQTLALELGVVFMRCRQFLRENGKRALYSTRVKLKEHSTNSDIQNVCVQRKGRVEVRVSKSRSGAKPAFDLVEAFKMHGGEMNLLSAFT